MTPHHPGPGSIRRILRLFLLLLASGVLVRADPDFTARELAQGYRDHVVLACPLDSQSTTVDAAEARAGIRVLRQIPSLHHLRVIALDASDTPARAIARLRATGRYAFVEPDYLRHIFVEPNDPAYVAGSMWNLKNTGANDGVAGADINAIAAWDLIHDAPNVVVAVVDTGIEAAHQDLAPNLWTNPNPTAGVNDLHGANFVSGNGAIVSGNPADDNGHGTHVAGIIGADGNNGVAIPGVAWKVQIMAVKVLNASGVGAASDIAAGIKYAVDHGATIINASYGAAGSTGYSTTELLAISYAQQKGVIFVAAAGNAYANLDISRTYPASFALDNIVAVGASDYRDQPAYYSNYGAAVDLFAPGDNITSLDYSSTTGTVVMSGTSMAAPHVCGALALLEASFPGDTYRQLINRLLRGVDPSANSTSTFVSKCQTDGRLDLFKALSTTTNRPFNDDFASRPRLNTANLAIRSSNAGATAEPGEPAHAGNPANASLWWEWNAPATGSVTISTHGSGYDTVLAVYTGTSLATLQSVASNDDASATDTSSRVTFNAVKNTSYEIAVDGKAGAIGLTLLNLGTTPANDAFASPVVLAGPSARADGSNANCTREPGEPLIGGSNAGGTSLWYQWTAPKSGQFQVSVTTADFDPLLAVYTGSSLASLTSVTYNAGTAATGAICTFNATAGTTYDITVDAKSSSTIGQFTLILVDSAWQALTGSSVTGSAAVGHDGTIYIGSTDGMLYAFGPDGTKLWTYATQDIIDTCSPTIAPDGSIYVGSDDGNFYAFNHAGTLLWKHVFGTSALVSNSPALATDGTLYMKPSDGYLYALNPADGSTKWRHNVNSSLSYASPAVALDGTVYIGVDGSPTGVLYALNPSDGSEKWHFNTASGEYVFSVPAIDAAGNLYFSVLATGRLYSLTSAGAKRWAFAPASSLDSSSSPALSADGSTAYYAGYDDILYAVNTATGALRWSYTLGDQIRASSPAVDANGVVYIGCYDDKLYAINPGGSLNRTWDTDGWIRSSPAIYGQMLYIGSNDFKVYAFNLGAGIAAGPWSQYRQNILRTGRAVANPVFITQPSAMTAAAGASVTLTAAVSGAPFATYQWSVNGNPISSATQSSLALSSLQPANAGIYTVQVTGDTTITSTPVVVGVTTTASVLGTGTVVGTNIVHPNGNLYDQVLLTGPAAAITAAPGHATRLSYIDLTDDIVQVEFAGAGTLSIVLDDATGPAAPVNYNQPTVSYMRGHAHLVVAGADETTNLSVFTVGRATAFDPTGRYNIVLPISATNVPADNGSPLFTGHDATNYDGIADLASVAIASTDGKFGGLRTADARYWADQGLTGIYAPGVAFLGPVYAYDIDAHDTATPVLSLGAADGNTWITGGDLLQDNNAAVQVSGITHLDFTAGTDSGGNLLPAQANRAVLEQNGADVTAQIVVNPTP